ncbi:hypothetical protein F4827_007112 [Paraburkholderia bannensis]|uniref:Adhesin n=1 Tax=Paraburkholderia bannensis TaxID=765414 RepID=A0A7W9U747_9BURK|nr:MULTISPECIES: hypothetical protein [Paraburkholderia]MBB3262322.1 hypothetical protein [Paraburkholderia sp. WP4_3_2]MBB6107230.1 hypothetical protein [Paraburkholderia bannensis]
MKVRMFFAAAICAATCVGAAPTFAGTATALSDDDSSTVFSSVKLTSLQDIGGSAKISGPTAAVGADVLRGASGNVGVNLAAGALNAQTNQLVLATTSQAEIVTQQSTHAVIRLIAGSASASLGAGALAGASGNIGINIAAGAGNAQSNALIVH